MMALSSWWLRQKDLYGFEVNLSCRVKPCLNPHSPVGDEGRRLVLDISLVILNIRVGLFC